VIHIKLAELVSIRYSGENDFVIGQMRIKDGPPPMTNRQINIKGTLPGAAIGSHYELRTELEVHPRYGDTYAVRDATIAVPRDYRALIAYLEKTMDGIGKARATAIVDAFGEDTAATLDRDDAAQQLISEAKIPTDVAEALVQRWHKDRDEREVKMLLLQAGAGMRTAAKINAHFNDLGEHVAHVVRTDPYRLMEVSGVGFKIADGIAVNVGIAPDAPMRLIAGAAHIASENTKSGHCWTPLDDLLRETGNLLQQPTHKIVDALARPNQRALIVIDDAQRCWPAPILRAEEQLTRGLRRLLNAPSGIARNIRNAKEVPNAVDD
jgi:exodeoxyribonuclease V alpha subunit